VDSPGTEPTEGRGKLRGHAGLGLDHGEHSGTLIPGIEIETQGHQSLELRQREVGLKLERRITQGEQEGPDRRASLVVRQVDVRAGFEEQAWAGVD
jgi:hypothetical protein